MTTIKFAITGAIIVGLFILLAWGLSLLIIPSKNGSAGRTSVYFAIVALLIIGTLVFTYFGFGTPAPVPKISESKKEIKTKEPLRITPTDSSTTSKSEGKIKDGLVTCSKMRGKAPRLPVDY